MIVYNLAAAGQKKQLSVLIHAVHYHTQFRGFSGTHMMPYFPLPHHI